MKIILRTYDFIKSWKYYPTMKKYLEEKCHVKCPYSRLRYALWHCRDGILSNAGIENLHTDFKSVSDSWETVYHRELITKKIL